MIAATRSELIKLRQRTYLVGILGMVAFMLVSMLLSVTDADQTTSDRGPVGLVLSRDELAAADALGRSLGNAVTFIGITALTLVAISVGTEYGSGTIRNLLVRQPRRGRLLLGKTTALLAYAAVGVLAASVAGAAVAFPLAPGNDIDTGAWTTVEGLLATLGGAANLVVAVWGWAALGLLLAVLLRSAPAAIGIGVAYTLPFEIVLTIMFEDASRWLPGQILQALARGGSPKMTYTTALLASLTWIAAATTVTLAIFRSRDETN